MSVSGMKKFLLLLSLALLGPAVCGCSFLQGVFSSGSDPQPLGHVAAPEETAPLMPGLILVESRRAGDSLASQLSGRIHLGGGILATTMVDLDDLDKTSRLGRLNMQQVASRLSEQGYKILESRLASELNMKKRQGEFMLTRESAKLLSRSYDAHAVLIGAYSESVDRLFLSVRVVRLVDSVVLAAYEYYLPKNDEVIALMGPLKVNANPGQERRGIWSGYANRERAF